MSNGVSGQSELREKMLIMRSRNLEPRILFYLCVVVF